MIDNLPGPEKVRISKAWWLDAPSSWRYHFGMGRVLMAVMSPSYVRRGWIARSMTGGVPKALSYKENYDEPWVHWASRAGDKVVIVEDIPSAERLNSYIGFAPCALMGTHMADNVADEIVEVSGNRPVIVALDRDAVGKSIEISNKLRGRCSGKVGVWVLQKDVKDMTPEELHKWVNESY